LQNSLKNRAFQGIFQAGIEIALDTSQLLQSRFTRHLGDRKRIVPSGISPEPAESDIMKLEISIVDAPKQMPTHTILDLRDYLTANVLEPMFLKDGVRWDRRFMNFFVLDNGCCPLEPTGLLKLNVPAHFSGRTSQLANAVTSALYRLGIRTGPLTCERNPDRPAEEIMVIPVNENPTALVAPPELNIAYARGCVVLHNLLGYQQVDGQFSFASDDVLKRASSVTQEQIAACVSSPVKVAQEIRRIPSPTSMRAINRVLEEIKRFAEWAVNHNYRKLVAA
jgi:hypothetical protein